ncbi:hypothetical protein D3C81_1641730 [compost metagenome]
MSTIFGRPGFPVLTFTRLRALAAVLVIWLRILERSTGVLSSIWVPQSAYVIFVYMPGISYFTQV